MLSLNFDMAGEGNLSSNIKLDGSGKAAENAIYATMKETACCLKLKRLFPTSLQPLQASQLNCMAADFGVTKGLMQTRRFIIDTDNAIIDVSGNINLAQEQLDLTINAKSKGLRY